jgi:ABC-type multidrug transport system ATPase subunit
MDAFRISLEKTGKRYLREWIFRNLALSLSTGDRVAVMGPNGSGKSTLLQLIAGYLLPTEGTVRHVKDGRSVDPDAVYRHIAIAAPYLELIEEFTLREIIAFHCSFKRLRGRLGAEEVIRITGLTSSADKVFKYFSSGMKQRVRLALALLSDTPVLLLDEPCSNLDRDGIRWYQELIAEHGEERIIVVCSNNIPEEYSFCDRVLQVTDWKGPVKV